MSALDNALLMHCLLVQDCEFTYLSTSILHLLGCEGPKTAEPAKYIRFIYNRIILENATVRAAAVSSLARFGAAVLDLRPRIVVLLRRALFDNDDEARAAPQSSNHYLCGLTFDILVAPKVFYDHGWHAPWCG